MTKDQSRARLYYLDWVRAGAMAAVFLFHAGRAFDHGAWHIKNAETTLGFSIFSTALVQWMMPTFFLVSGWVTFLILQRVDASTFVASRVKRLALPFVFGTLILVPHQVYIERVTQGGVRKDFLAWFPEYFDGWYAFGGNFAWMGLHLWYLEMLFVYSILLLPLFLAFRRPAAGAIARPLALVAGLAGPVLAIELIVGLFPKSIGRTDFGGWSFMTYAVWFVLGYLIGRHAGLQRELLRARHGSLAVALAGLALGLAIILPGGPDIGYVGERVVRVAVAWGGIAAFLGYASRHLNRDAAWRPAINEGILPFYILHQSVIVLIAYFVLPLALSPLVKFALIALLSLAAILGLYVFVVRPLAPVRFLFGLPARQSMGR